MTNQYYISAGFIPGDSSGDGIKNRYCLSAGLVPVDVAQEPLLPVNDPASLVPVAIFPLPGTESARAVDAAVLVPGNITLLSVVTGRLVIDTAQAARAFAAILPALGAGTANGQGSLLPVFASIPTNLEQAGGIDNAFLTNGRGESMTATEATALTDTAGLTNVSAGTLTAVTYTGGEIDAIFGHPVIMPVLNGKVILEEKLQGFANIN